ncbi:hypothetical protein JKF63_07479 [Porcisia hertigi]|uniref:Uncharacterized protein n=1 Tax=Porcisia hertigi TaxID=2761500 RepID=A0A836ICZ4_9TRYP|nr:hypothetical protein JKF63_07479 [Porcisia hertigi]
MVLPYPHGAEHVKKEQSAPPPQGGGAGGDYSVCYSSAKEKSGKGNDVCVLYSTAPQQHHFYRTLSAAAEPRGVCQRRREKRHHRYVRVHHRRQRGRRTPSRSLSSGKNGVGREKQSRVAGPLWTSSKGVGTARGGLTTCSPHLSTSSLLYYDDVDSDAVDDIYYQIEKRLFPIAAKTELIRGTRSSRPATPSPRSHAAEAAASPPGDAEEDPHEGSKESPIDALFTVLSVPLHLHLRGGFHLSDYYAPCPVCHPALLANSENGAAPGVDGTVSGRCSCSSVCPRPRRHSDSASKEILVASGNVLSLPTSSVLFTGASTLSGAHSAKGTSSVSLLSAEHAANLCDARRREQKAADPATAVNRGTTTAGKLTCFTRTAPSRIPPAGAVRGHVSSPSAAEASVRKYREDDGGVGCPPSPFVLSAPTRQSRYRRQRRRHKPAGIVARRRGAHHLGSGTGDGALRSQCSSFMRQCLLCVHINGRLAYIDPKGATGAARLLAGAALLAQKTKRKEAAKKQRHRVAANINEPTRTPITPLASQPG